ncbi:canalicular multispecific organic anion transporter 1-like protein [Labeo rohita]|uniref:Canalicular multispecific organic anion transporter 1-like protein n=1 Tax=Labeo rohita TaxID=84645 RepID=A0A498LEC1_LABRO|nr:canalicular multispecific organic anion transporter 1-like protein [Labeo rohita]
MAGNPTPLNPQKQKEGNVSFPLCVSPPPLHMYMTMVVAGLLFLTAIAELALTLGEDYGPSSDSTAQKHPAVLYTNPVLFAVSWIVVMLCQESVRRRQKSVDSGSLFLFWLLQVVCAVFQFQTLLRDALNKDEIADLPRFCLFYISYGLQLIAFVLSAIADVSPEVKQMSKTNPEAKATFLSRITFNWFNSMVIKGFKRPLVQEDMWDLNEEDSTQTICQQFQDVMANELKKARTRLQQKQNKRKTKTDHQNGLAKGVSQDVLVMDKSSYAWTGYLYAVLLLVVAFFQSVVLQQYFQQCFSLGMKVRTALMAAVYKKALVVSNDSRKESTAGEIVNLMSADAQRFNDVTNFIHLLWSCPLQIVLSIAFLWIELGPSVLAGLLAMVLMVPINGWLATKSRGFQMENMKFKDSRMKIINDILNGIKVLKYYAWESSFEAQVQEIREKELKVMRKFAYLSSVSTFIFSCAPAIIGMLTITPCSESAADQESREHLIKHHYVSRVSELTAQLQMCDSKAVHFHAECRAVAKRLAMAEKTRETLTEELKLANQNITRLQDELSTTKRSYEDQLSMMSDHLCSMNDTLSKQRDEIDTLKLASKVSPQR